MTRPESWRLDAASYPVRAEMDTRFQDLDVNRHLNNVAFATLFENGRVLFNRDVRPWDQRGKDERTMVASMAIAYLREGAYPEGVSVCSGIGPIGRTSWTIEQAMFQSGACIATCDSVIVLRKDGAACPLSETLRAELESMRTRGG